MKLDTRFVASLFFVTVALVCMACAPKGGRVGAANGSQNRSNIASPVAAPLSVKVPNPARLTSISALRILPPTISSSVTDSSITVKGLQEIVEARADEALTMKVVPAAGAAKTDAVLKTEILSYRERTGSAIGGEPATVAFFMTLSRSSDGGVVWQANYFYQQEALSDNWLKIGQRFGSNGTGAGWVSAKELFQRGVSGAFEDLAARRDEQFTGPRESR